MATIRKRGDKWQAQVRRKGAKATSKSFFNRRDAEAWGRQHETAIDLGRPLGAQQADYTLGDLLGRYAAEVTPHKKGREPEARRLRRLQSDQIAFVELAVLDASALCAFRDRRSKDGLRACQYDLVLIRHAIDIGRREWGIVLHSNPVAEIRIPNGIRSRERRLAPGEFEKLSMAALSGRNRLTWSAIELAVETAMRRSELLRLEWSDVDFVERLARLADTKNGRPRSVPLTAGALAVLSALPRSGKRVLPLTECALRQSWERLVARAALPDLHFHDLRHEAVSRFFELGLSLPEVALISGHRDPRMLFKYTHLRPSDVVGKLHSHFDQEG